MSHSIRKVGQLGVLAAVVMAGQSATAADHGVYLGAGVVHSSIDTTSVAISNNASSVKLNDGDNGFKVVGGVRARDWLAVEANYIDFGKINTTTSVGRSEFGLKGVDAFAVFLFSAPFVDVFAKAGGIRWQSEGGITAVGTTIRNNDSGFDVAYGTGVQARLRSLGIRLEYEQFNVKDADKVSAVSLSVMWTFL